MPLTPGLHPILDYDDAATAIIDPYNVLQPRDDMPERVVISFLRDVVADVCKDATVIRTLGSESGTATLYRLETEYGTVAVIVPGVGAPLCITRFEALIALGGRKFVACGACGVLVKDIAQGAVIIPQTAVRDEGTSYHYLPADAEARAHPDAMAAITTVLEARNVPYHVGKTWTTDAPYRETRAMVNRRIEQGCVVVEMETSALMAVAQFRRVVFGQLLYGGDDLAGDAWDARGWHRDLTSREKVFWLAVEAACKL